MVTCYRVIYFRSVSSGRRIHRISPKNITLLQTGARPRSCSQEPGPLAGFWWMNALQKNPITFQHFFTLRNSHHTGASALRNLNTRVKVSCQERKTTALKQKVPRSTRRTKNKPEEKGCSMCSMKNRSRSSCAHRKGNNINTSPTTQQATETQLIHTFLH